jgi:energy-converting hydrogenase Eha subunit A
LPFSSDTFSQPQPKQSYWFYYLLGIALGALAGYVNVRVEDLMLTAVMVTAFAMLVAFIRPDRPWRSAVLVTALIPIGEIVAFKMTGQKLNRAGISEAILAILPANAGAYGGAALRMVIRELWPKKHV